jgi:4-hydroxybenzoate polyprenyltransferase
VNPRNTNQLAMDLSAGRGLATARRHRWRSYLALSRISNLPTVWTNVLAGMCLSSAAVTPDTYFRVSFAISLFYIGGMFLNDAFDAPFDRRFRPDRPIPSEELSRGEVFIAGGALLGAGELLLASHGASLVLGAALAAAIVLYDYRHKGSSVAPLVMGTCRGLVYCIAAASVAGLNTAAAIGAVIMASYVVALTVVAKIAGPNARWLVPGLIAGISLVDAALIATMSSSVALAALGAGGFGLTLFLQRYVRGD